MRELRGIFLRGLCLAALLTAASCAQSSDMQKMTFDDPVVNHPIAVEPSPQSLKVAMSPSGMAQDDLPRFYAFISDYQSHGSGKILISAPRGALAGAEAGWIADRINAMGVSRDQILVANHDPAPGDDRVEMNFVSYRASTAPCGDWSEDLADTGDNKTAANLGCAVQHNLAAMVSDPRDLLGPRPLGGADADRRATVITNYEKGVPTAATKTPDQSSAISDVGR